MAVLDKYLNTIPSVYDPKNAPVISALVRAWALSDELITSEIQNAKNQLFVRTATGQYLVNVANSLGVRKPFNIGLSDEDFQELIPNLSLKPKQIKQAFYNVADLFWGELYTRANKTSVNAEPYNVSVGETIVVNVDNGANQTITVLADEIATGGAATADEMVGILNRIVGMTVSRIDDVITGTSFVNVRTDTRGSVGTFEVVSGTMLGASKFNLAIGVSDILDLSERFVVYQVNEHELKIEIPATLPLLRRSLKGAHHLHSDSTLEGPVAPENGIWQGSFIFDPKGTQGSFTLTSQIVNTVTNIPEGSVQTTIQVDDTSGLENTSGLLVFGFGTVNQEQPVKYIGVPNSNTLSLDPSHVFAFAHAPSTVVNYLREEEPLKPSVSGEDLAVYLTHPTGARNTVQSILGTLNAAGVRLTFLVAAPEYTYLIDSPYVSTDDGTSV